VISGPLEGKFWMKMATKFPQEDFEFVFVTKSRKFAKSPVAPFDVTYAPDCFEEIAISSKEIGEFEKRYGKPTLKAIYSSDYEFVQNLVTRSEHEWTIETLRYLHFWEIFIREKKIDCILVELGADLIRRTAMRVAEKYGIITLYLNSGPLPKTFFLSTNEMGIVEEMKEAFDENTGSNEMEEAANFINSFRQTSRMMVHLGPPKLDSQSLRLFIDALNTDIFVEKRNNPYLKIDKRAKNYLTRFFRSKIVRRYYKKPVPGEKFVFFPLHCPYDMQLTVRAPQYLDQAYVVKECYKSLPAGYKLYVKEHHASVGAYDVGFIRSINKMENARVINPYHDSHDLIRHASAIIVINSTVGWEGILYHKPVVVLAHPFYRGFGVTYDVDNLFDLPSKLNDALNGQIDHKRIKRFVYSVMSSMQKGTLIAFDEEQLKNALDVNNNNKMNKVIATHIEKLMR